jgi:hypothetical protein
VKRHERLRVTCLRADLTSLESSHIWIPRRICSAFGAFRNTTAHAPKIYWNVTEQDALDILTTISLIHRRLDSAVPTPSIVETSV